MIPTISVLGAGRMGAALVKQLVKQGYTTAVWNRSAAKAQSLAAAGARVAATVEDAIAGADIVIVNLTDYAASNAVLETESTSKALQSKILVQLSTGTPKQSREMAAWAAERAIEYLDGAILVTPNQIGEPACAILYSGPAAVFEKCKTHLLALGGEAIYLGQEAGSASTLDAALLAFLWSIMFGAQQAAAICQAEGFPLPSLAQSLQGGLPFLGALGVDTIDRIDKGRFESDQATLEICHSSVRLIIEMCKEHSIDHGVPDAMDAIFTKAVEAGHAQSDFAIVNRLMRPQRMRGIGRA